MISPYQVVCNRCNKPVDRLVATEDPGRFFTDVCWRVRVWCHGESDIVIVDRLTIEAARPGDTLRAFIGAPGRSAPVPIFDPGPSRYDAEPEDLPE